MGYPPLGLNYLDHRCPNCGANLPPPPPSGTLRCPYCATALAAAPGQWTPLAPLADPDPLADPHLPRFWIGGARYAVLGRIAPGVHLARRDGRATELVVVKTGDRAREWEILEKLQKLKSQGAPHFTRLLPQPVRCGAARLGMNGRDGERAVLLYRWRSGFIHTFDEIAVHHPPAAAAVWLWKRILEVLGWIHRGGWTHGAVHPSHLLVHPRDHGVVLIGWARAVQGGRPADDIAASARCVLGVSNPGGNVGRLLETAAGDDAWALRDRLDEAALEDFGPPKYVPLTMPGWN